MARSEKNVFLSRKSFTFDEMLSRGTLRDQKEHTTFFHLFSVLSVTSWLMWSASKKICFCFVDAQFRICHVTVCWTHSYKLRLKRHRFSGLWTKPKNLNHKLRIPLLLFGGFRSSKALYAQPVSDWVAHFWEIEYASRSLVRLFSVSQLFWIANGTERQIE